MDDIRKTNRCSQEEKQAFIQEFKTAGLEQSLAGFCGQKGISESMLRGLLGRKEQTGVNVTYISQQVTE